MKILADTHTFLWFVTDAPQLSAKAKMILEAQDTERFFSIAGVWEIAIETSLGELTLRKPLEEFLPPNNSPPTVSLCSTLRQNTPSESSACRCITVTLLTGCWSRNVWRRMCRS